jgi:hypothetical protein
MNHESGVVGRQSQRTNARRMYYSAKVMGGEPGLMTVAMYQCDDTEEVSAHKTPRNLPDDYYRNGDSSSKDMSLFGDLQSFSIVLMIMLLNNLTGIPKSCSSTD